MFVIVLGVTVLVDKYWQLHYVVELFTKTCMTVAEPAVVVCLAMLAVLLLVTSSSSSGSS